MFDVRIARKPEFHKLEWKPSDTAPVLWLLVAAMLIGWLVVILVGHPVLLTP